MLSTWRFHHQRKQSHITETYNVVLLIRARSNIFKLLRKKRSMSMRDKAITTK